MEDPFFQGGIGIAATLNQLNLRHNNRAAGSISKPTINMIQDIMARVSQQPLTMI
jgi:hypothetical protein